MEFRACEFKRYEPHFNSNFVAIDYEDLVEIKSLAHNTVVVSFKGEQEQFVHKFMDSKCHQTTFEYEVDNYLNLVGISGVPVLRALVQKSRLNQGFLILYINGPNLWAMVKNGPLEDESLLLDITEKIVHVAADLEERNFYHEDLKCSNIVREHSTGDIYFIDFGGGRTEGMYLEDREHCAKPDAVGALFTLGRTIWYGPQPSLEIVLRWIEFRIRERLRSSRIANKAMFKR